MITLNVSTTPQIKEISHFWRQVWSLSSLPRPLKLSLHQLKLFDFVAFSKIMEAIARFLPFFQPRKQSIKQADLCYKKLPFESTAYVSDVAPSPAASLGKYASLSQPW
jgi:hypothetical protein